MKTWKELVQLKKKAFSKPSNLNAYNWLLGPDFITWVEATKEINEELQGVIFLDKSGDFCAKIDSDYLSFLTLDQLCKIRDALIALDLGPVTYDE